MNPVGFVLLQEVRRAWRPVLAAADTTAAAGGLEETCGTRRPATVARSMGPAAARMSRRRNITLHAGTKLRGGRTESPFYFCFRSSLARAVTQ